METLWMGMRAGRARALLVLVSVALVLGAAQGCALLGSAPPRDPISADVSIVSDPEGGLNVTSLACTFVATSVSAPGTEPVTLRAKWVASCGVHKTEVFTFSGDEETFLTSYGEPDGYPLTKTFWVEITWEDARGSHTVKSAQAACTAL